MLPHGPDHKPKLLSQDSILVGSANLVLTHTQPGNVSIISLCRYAEPRCSTVSSRFFMEIRKELCSQQKPQDRTAFCLECGASVSWSKAESGGKYVGYCKPCKMQLRYTKLCTSCWNSVTQEPGPSAGFGSKGTSKGRMDYCPNCLRELGYSPDGLLATFQGNDLGGIEKKTFGASLHKEARSWLEGLGQVPYRVDLHSCLDPLNPSEVLFDELSMCVSYVGYYLGSVLKPRKILAKEC